MAIAREQIVGAVTGQDDFHMAAHEFGQEKSGQHTRERLIEMSHHFRQPVNHVARMHDQFVMVGIEVAGHQTREFDVAFVGRLIRISQRECVKLLIADLACQRHDQR